MINFELKLNEMKKIIIILMLFAYFATTAQKVSEKEVPASVVAKFNSLYPGIKYKWEKEKGNYEANFEQNDVEISVLFDALGNLLQTETEIKIADLPDSVVQYVHKNYAGAQIKEAAKILDAKGATTYEAELKGLDLIFDINGKFIKSEKD